MATHCTKCNIHWTRLLTCDSTKDDQVEVCPVCLTDMFLTEVESEEGHFMCGITGNVINTKTKEVLNLSVKHEVKPVRTRTVTARTWQEWERLEDIALAAYHKSGNEEDYFNAFK